MKLRHGIGLALVLLLGIRAPGLRAQAPSTPLTLGPGSFTFLVLSDWGRDGIHDTDNKTPGQLKVARQLARTAQAVAPALLMTCGDNFHGKGVPSVDDPLWTENVEKVYADPALALPWYITLGNHDYEGNVEAELAYAKTHPRWIQPARYYAFTKSLEDGTEVLFVVLDSSPLVQPYVRDAQDRHHVKGQDAAAQTAWLKGVLAASRATWKLAFFHHPAYSAAGTHGSTEELQQAWVPLFEQYHVDACFSGHDHDLQHSHPDHATVEYFGVGGGSDTRPAGKAAFTRFSKASLGFGVASLTRQALRFTFVNDQGAPLYTCELKK